MHTDTYPANLQIKVSTILITIFQILETKVCTFKKLHSDTLKMDLFLKVFHLGKYIQPKRIFTPNETHRKHCDESHSHKNESWEMNLIYIKIGPNIAKMKAGSILTSQESSKTCSNHGSSKIATHLTIFTFWKKNGKRPSKIRVTMEIILIENKKKINLINGIIIRRRLFFWEHIKLRRNFRLDTFRQRCLSNSSPCFSDLDLELKFTSSNSSMLSLVYIL